MNPASQPNEPLVYRGYGALRRGRCSEPYGQYFLTICLQRPARCLTAPELRAAISEAALQVERDNQWEVRTAVIMPDHVHLLVRLTANGELAAAVKLFKGRTSLDLREHGSRWQPGYYDHRLRSDEEVQPSFLYIFLNPYRADLLQTGAKWPGYFCRPDDWEWFKDLTNDARPFPEWLR